MLVQEVRLKLLCTQTFAQVAVASAPGDMAEGVAVVKQGSSLC